VSNQNATGQSVLEALLDGTLQGVKRGIGSSWCVLVDSVRDEWDNVGERLEDVAGWAERQRRAAELRETRVKDAKRRVRIGRYNKKP
jgi:hypothetical protein